MKPLWRLPPLYSLLVALQFMTRLPVPRELNPSAADLVVAARWFPIVGAIVGGLMASAAAGLLSIPLAPGLVAMLVLLLGVLLTGAFHEDGLADSADGIGGAFARADRLRIMRDSRVGTYGALALVLLLGLRAACLWSMAPSAWTVALILAHALGRWSSLLLLRLHPYVRLEEPGLGKPLVAGASGRILAVTGAGAVLAALLLAGSTGLWACGLAVGVAYGAGRYFHRRLGGITGDTLGAANVACEVAVLVLFAAVHPAVRSPWV